MYRNVLLALGALTLLTGPVLAYDGEVVYTEPVPAQEYYPAVVGGGYQPSVQLHDWTGPAYPSQPHYRRKGGGLEVGVGVAYLRPTWDRNPAFNLGGPGALNNVDFDWNHEISPYGYFTFYFHKGLGIRARYWDFDHDESLGAVVPAGQLITSARPLGLGGFPVGAGANVQVFSELDFYVVDLEGVMEWCCGNFEIGGSAGVRFLDISQNYAFFAGNAGVISTSEFRGIGPTLSVEGSYRFGCTGISLFANSRFSVMFGDEDQTAFHTTPGPLQRTNRSQGVLSIGELVGGVRFEKNCGKVCPFVELAGVGQVWWGAGNSSNSNLGFGPGNGGFDSSDMGLFGGRVTIGLKF